MTKLSISEVSNRFNVSRSTLYRALKEGRISRNSDGLFDVAEVIRCFGEPIKKQEHNQVTEQPKDDADLRQLVDFMKKEIESYKDREKRYLDQIDRFQLLLGHKDTESKLSHETPVTRTSGAPCDNDDNPVEDIENKGLNAADVSHETPVTRTSGAPISVPDTRLDTKKNHGFWGRMRNALFNDN